VSLDAKILSALRKGGVSGADLSAHLGVTRSAIWARIRELRAFGYEIEASPHDGYRLTNLPDVLHADDLMSLVQQNKVIGRDIRVFQETGSTNDVVDKLARDGVGEGVVVFAEAQTKGRGRLGRKWISPARKGLWFSILLRPDLRPSAATQLTVAAATALVRAIRGQAGVEPKIKWPNDILLNGKKIAGVLTELSAELDRIKYVILGIGVDVNLGSGDLPADLRKMATSLRIEAGRTFRRADLAAAILGELEKDYGRIRNQQFAGIADEWERHCATLGHQVKIQMGGRLVQGRAESLDQDGALLLRTDHGHLERIIGGDVTVEK
jgi:BirA family biotin operon repressor/biotin-[acetyl-CoA-carboxylase] ligase